MQVIGLCRFSYPAIGGFQVEHDSIEERIAFLYGEARLEERFRLFETVALPCLRAQTDPDFDLIVVIGDSLPAHHEARLRDLVAGMPQVRIEKHPPMPQRAVMKDILNKARRDPDKPCLQFRYDDDDADLLNETSSAAAPAKMKSGKESTPGPELSVALVPKNNFGFIAKMVNDTGAFNFAYDSAQPGNQILFVQNFF